MRSKRWFHHISLYSPIKIGLSYIQGLSWKSPRTWVSRAFDLILDLGSRRRQRSNKRGTQDTKVNIFLRYFPLLIEIECMDSILASFSVANIYIGPKVWWILVTSLMLLLLEKFWDVKESFVKRQQIKRKEWHFNSLSEWLWLRSSMTIEIVHQCFDIWF